MKVLAVTPPLFSLEVDRNKEGRNNEAVRYYTCCARVHFYLHECRRRLWPRTCCLTSVTHEQCFCTLKSQLCSAHVHSDISGVFLIDPAVESLFDKTNPQSQGGDGVEPKETPWREYWYRGAMPRMQSVHLSAMLGFNRLALMLGLMSPLEDKDLKLPESVVTRKVRTYD